MNLRKGCENILLRQCYKIFHSGLELDGNRSSLYFDIAAANAAENYAAEVDQGERNFFLRMLELLDYGKGTSSLVPPRCRKSVAL